MAHSYADTNELNCPQCEEVFKVDVWLIVDIIERQDLLQRIRDKSLHTLTCPKCAAQLAVDAPLLIYRSGKEPAFIFCPGPSTTPKRFDEDLSGLVGSLRGSLRNVSQDREAEGVFSMPFDLLPTNIPDAPETELSEIVRNGIQEVANIREVFDSIVYEHKGNPNTAWVELVTVGQNILAHPCFVLLEESFQLRILHMVRDCLALRYVNSGNRDGLDEVLWIWEQILERTPPDSPELLADNWGGRGSTLHERYTLTRDPNDLEMEIESFKVAVQLSTPTSPYLARRLHELACGLIERNMFVSDPSDLEDSIKYLNQAIEVTKPDSPDLIFLLDTLSLSLRYHHDRTNNPTDVTRAIECLERLTHLITPDSLTLPSILSRLGLELQELYQITGEASDLDRSIDYCQQAVQHSQLHGAHQDDCLSSLASGFVFRYYRKGELADLEQAVRLLEQAESISAQTASANTNLLDKLGSTLRERYIRTGDMTDLERSIKCHEQAVRLISPNSLIKPRYLNNLANSLLRRCLRLSDHAELARSIECLEEAASLTPADSPYRSIRLNNWAGALRKRYEMSGSIADLEEGIELLQQAVRAASLSAPARATYLLNLGDFLRNRYDRSSHPDDLNQAVKCYRQGCEQGINVDLAAALDGSLRWGEWALKRAAWGEALRAFSYGRQAIEQLYKIQLSRSGKEAWLRSAQTLPAQAAYAFAQSGDLLNAVLTLEEGRAKLLADAIERDSSDLRRLINTKHAGLYEHYLSAAETLGRLENIELNKGRPDAGFDLRAEIHAARANLTDVIESIQRISGFEEIFRAPTFEDIQRALTTTSTGTAGDVVGVYLIITPVGGVALIIHSSGVEPTWLDFNEDDLTNLLVKYDGQQVTGGYLVGQLEGAFIEHALDEVLPVLSHKIMQPVAVALNVILANSEVSPKNQTLHLIPTGLLSLLPLHAAWHLADGEERNLLEDFDVAYAPSARVLRHSRATLSSLPNDPLSLLGIGNPTPLPSGIPPVMFATVEVEEIALLFSCHAKLLCEAQATRAAIEAGLDTSTYIHFACHGQFNSHLPLASALILSAGEQLTLADLLSRPKLRTTRLAVLSACQTAITDFNHLPEEAVGLPSGFLQAGVPGVIGSLWPVNDLSTALLMIKFYEYHLQGESTDGEAPMSPAHALRRAQQWLRNVTNAELSELFERFKQAAPDAPEQSRMIYALAKEKFRDYTLNNPNGRPFAHPYYWAALAFYGV